jgi:hypothetical protein
MGVDMYYQLKARLKLNSTEPVSEAEQTTILAASYMLIDRLREGKMTYPEYINLCRSVCTAFCLAGEVYKLARNKAQLEIEASEHVFLDAARALGQLGERYAERGNYVARLQEIEQLRSYVSWYEPFLAVATQGIMLRAKTAAEMLLEQMGVLKCN